MTHLGKFSCLFIVALFFSGCATVWAERASTWQPEKPVPALLVHFNVVTPAKSIGLLDIAKSITGHDDMTQIGTGSIDALKAGMMNFNMGVFLDADRAHKLDDAQTLFKVDMPDAPAALQKTGAVLANVASNTSGAWIAPETARQSFHEMGTLLKDKFFTFIAKSVAGSNTSEVFVSAEVTLLHDKIWLWHFCKASVRLRALDVSGKPVFQALTYGQSPKIFWGSSSVTPTCAKDAVLDALVEVAKAKVGTLN